MRCLHGVWAVFDDPNPGLKIPALVGSMVAGADSIADIDLLGHGGVAWLFTGIWAPSRLGSFLAHVHLR
ncbi:MAG TPA: hypothetical protein VK053_00420 [Jiangellaceae bacterium]|nr:hypothetical protein [Jiangellaceae bacterium]